VAGWGDDPILEELRTLIEEGWEVVSIEEDVDTDDGPADRVVIRAGADGEPREFVSDHLAFHRYVTGLQGETY
jgi:hypothetical protein